MSRPANLTPLPPAPIPLALTLHAASRTLEVRYPDGTCYRIPAELLRVYSPSAEVRGHTGTKAVLQTGKRDVGITAVDPVGHYAIRLHFSDGHSSGIYTWDYLHGLAHDQENLWTQYLQRLADAGVDRDAPMPAPGRRACH